MSEGGPQLKATFLTLSLEWWDLGVWGAPREDWEWPRSPHFKMQKKTELEKETGDVAYTFWNFPFSSRVQWKPREDEGGAVGMQKKERERLKDLSKGRCAEYSSKEKTQT